MPQTVLSVLFFACEQLPIPQYLTHNIYSARALNIIPFLEDCKGLYTK